MIDIITVVWMLTLQGRRFKSVFAEDGCELPRGCHQTSMILLLKHYIFRCTSNSKAYTVYITLFLNRPDVNESIASILCLIFIVNIQQVVYG